MPHRSILLRVLFISLAIAAVCGALGILLASYTAVWRITSTSLLTAFAAMLLLGASAFAGREQSRRAALLSVTVVVVDYLLANAAIWDLLGQSNREELLLMVLFIAIVGAPAVAFMRLCERADTAVAGWTGLVMAAIELGMLLIVAWTPWQSLRATHLDGLSALFAPLTIATVICLLGARRHDPRPWRWLGVAAAATAFGIASRHLFVGDFSQMPDVLTYFVSAAVVVAHANIVCLCSLKPRQYWLRYVTIGAAIVSAVFTDIVITQGIHDDTMIQRVAGASGIVAGCGTLALAVLATLNKRFATSVAPAELRDITLLCPVCHKKQTVGLDGTARCGGCGLIIQVKVEEPRCATCGYSLLMLRSGVCPECGTPAPAPTSFPSTVASGGAISPV